MGCDIHGFIEVRIGDKWVFVRSNVFNNPRDYQYFGALAGVRFKDVVPIQVGRGLPADVDVSGSGTSTNPDEWDGDHSHGWVNILDIDEWLGEPFPSSDPGITKWETPYIRELRGLMMGIAEDFSVTDEDVRYVFWFDS